MKTQEITICFLAVFAAHAAFATNYYVPEDHLTIEAAVYAAQDSDTVILAPGRYSGPGNRMINFKGKKVTVRSTDPGDPQIVNNTIIDCESKGNGFVFYMGEQNDSKVEGITITNGYSFLGGAIYCYNNSSPAITGCVFVNNEATFGGAIASAGAGSCPKITNCHIKANRALVGGGGILCNTGSPVLRNCLITGNYAPQGGAIYSWNPGSPVVTTCTIASNSALQRAGGIYCFRSSNLVLTNTILWGDTAPYAPEVLVGYSGVPTTVQVAYCDIQGGSSNVICEVGSTVNWGVGNIDLDPCFATVAMSTATNTNSDGDYHLLGNSGCIDAGDPAFAAEPDEKDIDGEPRVSGVRIDIGADEHKISAITALVDLKPPNINPASNVRWIMGAMALPDGYDVGDIDVSTVRLNETIEPAWDAVDEETQKLLVKFRRTAIQPMLNSAENSVLLTITGSLNDGTRFEGSDTIRILKSNGKGKK